MTVSWLLVGLGGGRSEDKEEYEYDSMDSENEEDVVMEEE